MSNAIALTVAELVASLSRGKGARFASLTYRTTKTKELARHTLIVGANLENLYRKDIEILEALRGDIAHTVAEAAAVEYLLASRLESLEKGIGNNSANVHRETETRDATYVHIDGLPGFKVHAETGVIYVHALSEGKVVIEAGEPQTPVKSSAQTIARNAMRRLLPSERFRQFTLKSAVRCAVNGDVLELVAE